MLVVLGCRSVHVQIHVLFYVQSFSLPVPYYIAVVHTLLKVAPEIS